MNYGNIKYFDIADGIGVRTTLFVSGCTHHCRDCFQPETWDFDFGEEFTEVQENEIIESLKGDYVEGLTLLGGEPFEPGNQKVLLPFLKRVREEVPDKSIWAYSGFTWEELNDPENKRCHTEDTLPMLSLLDILVDGEFHTLEKDLTLRFRGSANQRVLDVKKSFEEKVPVLSEYNDREKLG
ncbi:MAG: anaerobic ribonucleoside-triphosphate reductase activating protein [Lachnospiraceae bacterium]|nr:anaerobic ribonucleoside-triphosphate reductase activating protein [Lachnospiraceae bacterium]